MRELTVAQARALTLHAQGFGERRPARATVAHIRKTVRRLQLLQIDSVNVLVRAHYLPLFSRIGPYPRVALDRIAYRDRELFEYWGHEASLLPVELWPLCRWRMDLMQEGLGWKRFHAWAGANDALIEGIYSEIRERGPLGVSDLSDPGERAGPWWGWADGKSALEYLFWVGRVTASGRRNFERLYDLTERVLPAEVLAAPKPSLEESYRELLLRAARALGVGTASDLADYFRIHKPWARPLVRAMGEDGALEPVRVEGWRDVAYVLPGARVPRTPVHARALLVPFDPLVFERARTERLFGFHYRIEIYTPAPKRVFGYYVLPFLMGDRLVGRVDLKADRKDGALLAQASWLEPGEDPDEVAPALAAELRLMAAWLDLDRVVVRRKGGLAPHISRALRS